MNRVLILFALLAVNPQVLAQTTHVKIEEEFARWYEPRMLVSQGLLQAQTNLDSANSSNIPRFIFVQNLEIKNYQTTSLEASLNLSYNLIDSKRMLQQQMGQLQLKFAILEREFEKTESLSVLKRYLQALNTYELAMGLLRGLEADVRKQRPQWTPSTPAKQFAPNEIDSYIRFLEFVDTRKALETQIDRIRKQIAKWTKIDVTELAEGEIDFPGDPVLSAPVDISRCVENGAVMQRANLRLEQEKVYEALRNDASPVLTVSGQVAATTAPATGQSAFSGQVALTLNIPFPPNTPVIGGGQVILAPTGVTQTATLTYPNPLRQADPKGVYWAEKNVADTREAVTDDLNETLRSRESLIANVQLAKQRLEWGERSLRDAANADALAKLNARFALMGLKVRGAYDHLNLQLNTLTLGNTCQIAFTYAPRDAVFDIPKVGGL